MKKRVFPFLLGLAGMAGVVAAFASGTSDEADDAVVLGEEDLTERAEILRNQFRRMTPGDAPLVQDIGTWPAAWEEFSQAWDSAPATRDLATWLVPVEVARDGEDTMLLDGNGAELWRGETDFSKEESSSVTLTGWLVDEDDWPLYEAARAALSRRLASQTPSLRDGEGGGVSNELTGLRFVSVAADFTNTPPSFMVGLTWTNTGTVDMFAYGPLHVAETNEVTYTNDQNVVVNTNVVTWHSVESGLSGFDNDWTFAGTLVVTNLETNVFVDTGFTTDRAKVRFYAAAPAVDSDGDGLNDGFEIFVSHSNPAIADTDEDGIDDYTEHISGTSAGISNAWWITLTSNNVPYWRYLGSNTTWSTNPSLKYGTNVVGASPAETRVVKDVWLDGYVDDAIKVNGTFVDFSLGPQIFTERSITNLSSLWRNGSVYVSLYDCPTEGYSGHNEVRLGDTNGHPFMVSWEWWVPMDFRLEHINTNGYPLLVNPSGTRTNREFTCQATVLPTDIPDSAICWSCSTPGMSFVGGVTNGRSVQMIGNQPCDWTVSVTVVSNSFGAATLHGKILEKKTVPLRLHIVRDSNGENAAMSVEHFTTLLQDANKLFEQAAIEFKLEGNVTYIDNTSFLEISTSDGWLEYGQLQSTSSNTCGVEVYCINNFVDNRYHGLNWSQTNSKAGLTIVTNATARTLAHELGHACGLADIYVEAPIDNPTNQLSDDAVQESWLQSDWCPEAPQGGYGTTLTLPQLVQRLLMYGYDNQDAIDLPSGNVHGLDLDGNENDINVGLTGMGARTPSHW